MAIMPAGRSDACGVAGGDTRRVSTCGARVSTSALTFTCDCRRRNSANPSPNSVCAPERKQPIPRGADFTGEKRGVLVHLNGRGFASHQIEVRVARRVRHSQQRAGHSGPESIDHRPQPYAVGLPHRGIDAVLLGRNHRRPAFALEDRGVTPLNRHHGAQHGAVPRTPRQQGTKYVFPHHHAAAVHPRRVQLAGMIATPALDLVLHVAALEPLVPHDAWNGASSKPCAHEA